MSETPEAFNCERCIASKKQNRTRGRDCLLKRDLTKSPLAYSFRVGNIEYSGSIKSDKEFYEAIEKAFEVYKTKDIGVALHRIGKGVCPRSFPTTRQSYYFLELYDRTHGGQTGLELTNLPIGGGILDQPYVFFSASDIITGARARYINGKREESKNKVYREPPPEASHRGEKRFGDRFA